MALRIHGCSFAAVLLALSGGAKPPAASGAEIRIWPTAVVAGDAITLGDIADLRGFGPIEEVRLARLTLHTYSRPTGDVLLLAAEVRNFLREADVNLGEVRIFGASRCKVSRLPATRSKARRDGERRPRASARKPEPKSRTQRKRLPADSLGGALHAYIESRIANIDGYLEITFSPASAAALALRGSDYQFSIRAFGERRLGLLSFEIDVSRAGAFLRSETVAAEVLWVREVVVAGRPINQGQTITARDLWIEERRFSRLNATGMSDLAAATGFQSLRFFRQGDMLEARYLESRPLVRRGDLVRILIRGEGLEITTSGRAQDSGALGDLVTVRRDGAKRKQDLIEAVVAGPGLVTYMGVQQMARR